MSVTSTTGVTSTTSNATADSAASRIPLQVLGQDDFLKLLATQMSSQDPLNPQSDTQFVAQMAQFSALEQSKAMQSDMSQISSAQNILQADSLLGKTVSLQDDSGATAQGTVSAVQIQAGTPQIIVDGQPYDLSQVLSIMPAQAGN